eukprot:scaffold3339_cov174-Amphora_coffeaeformis.AAC.3
MAWYLSFSSVVKPVKQMTGIPDDTVLRRCPSSSIGSEGKSRKLRLRLRPSKGSMLEEDLRSDCAGEREQSATSSKIAK